MRFGSVCSGIEAASVAWEPLGFEAAWFSEVDPFASSVLRHRWPHVPNLGDMTQLRQRVLAREIEAPDVLVGGTPCQAFSVSGLRRSLSDERGNLTLSFVELLDAIDAVRADRNEEPAFGLWENVPGVFTVEDNAFGCFLAGLVGSDAPIVPVGGWKNAGVVAGPKRVAAWRVLDAQYFRVPQRRRRVFVLARGGARAWTAADALLPFTESVRWNPPPSRGARKDAAGAAADGAGVGCDINNQTPLLAEPIAVAFRGREGDNLPELGDDKAFALRAGGGGSSKPFVLEPIPFDETQITHRENRSRPEPGDPSPTISKGARPPAIAFKASHYTRDKDGAPEVAPPLTADADKGDQDPLVLAYSIVPESGQGAHLRASRVDVAPAITTEEAKSIDRGTRIVESEQSYGWRVRRLLPVECERLQAFPDGHTDVPGASDTGRYATLGNSMCTSVMAHIGRAMKAAR